MSDQQKPDALDLDALIARLRKMGEDSTLHHGDNIDGTLLDAADAIEKLRSDAIYAREYMRLKDEKRDAEIARLRESVEEMLSLSMAGMQMTEHGSDSWDYAAAQVNAFKTVLAVLSGASVRADD